MKRRRPNYWLVKIHRNYTLEDAATLLEVHKNTVRAWIKQGLATCDAKRPILILGQVLRDFLKAKRTKNKQKCQPGEIFCLRCRAPKIPAGDMADYLPSTPTLGSLIGICPCCNAMMYQRVNPAKLDLIRGKLDIRFPQAPQHIVESIEPFVNSDLR